MRISSCDRSSGSLPGIRERLRRDLEAHAYPGYVYGYPHKKAYRSLQPSRALDEVWAEESRNALFCYVHLPFCNQRCSFCNLFTYVPISADSPTTRYLHALTCEMEMYAKVLSPARFRRLYFGGGTPTFLTSDQLRLLVRQLRDVLGVDPTQTHGCIETSPETLDEDKVGVLRELGFQRISLGVQSLVPEELRQINRRFDPGYHARAFQWIGQAGFPHFNVDLIYGLPGQTLTSWQHSLEGALESPATSLFLYPLYIRPLTGLDARKMANTSRPERFDLRADQHNASRSGPTPHDMGRFYDHAVRRLMDAGFDQVTTRQFRREPPSSSHQADLEYRCQQDGMVGLGAGARSYTQTLHYSTPWRMVTRNIRAEVEDYCNRMEQGDSAVRHGFALDTNEQQRRFTILSLLYDGLDLDAFACQFGVDARTVYREQWEALSEQDCVWMGTNRVKLTPRGVRHADIVGQLFFSERVRQLVDSYEYDT